MADLVVDIFTPIFIVIWSVISIILFHISTQKLTKVNLDETEIRARINKTFYLYVLIQIIWFMALMLFVPASV